MVEIDLLITKANEEFTLSDLGLNVTSVNTSSAGLDVQYSRITNNSRKLRNSSSYTTKNIQVAGNFVASNLFDYEELKDELNAKLVDEESYFITKMLPTDDSMFNYELPGERTGDINFLEEEHEPYKYRYDVILVGDVAHSFVGRSGRGLLYTFDLTFETDKLPFGETPASDIFVTNNIPYAGTAENSQLESGWILQLVASDTQSGDFYVQVGDRRFEHTSLTDIEAGDRFELKGFETELNDSNINNYTNYEHFILKPNNDDQITLDTNFVGTIEVLGLKDLYK